MKTTISGTMPTSTIQHHLDDATLWAYSAGTLPEAFNLIVASHLSLCDRCRAQAQTYDAVGGALLEAEPSQVSETALRQTLARLDAASSEAEQPRTASEIPTPLQDYVGADLAAVKWRAVGMGVKQAVLKTSSRASARLLLIPAGAAMPDHGHTGTEMTLVLKGAFRDESGYFKRGDIEIADSAVHHVPVADAHEDCICLAVTDSPLRFQGVLPRIWQRLIRI